MGWQATLSNSRPIDNPARSVNNCQSYSRLLDNGKGSGHPHVNPLTPLSFQFDCRDSPPKKGSPAMLTPSNNHCPSGLKGAGFVTGVGEIRGCSDHNYLHLCQTGGPRVIGV